MMRYSHIEDRKADEKTEQFLQQCVRNERLTPQEFAEISLDRGGVGCEKPTRLIRIDDFIQSIQDETGLPEEDVQRMLVLHLRSKRLMARSLELYLNYPAWTQAELAEKYRMPRRQVGHALEAVRRAWPALRFDPTNEGNNGVPALENMKRIEHYDCSDRLNSSKVEWF
jgi:hypothetical protein